MPNPQADCARLVGTALSLPRYVAAQKIMASGQEQHAELSAISSCDQLPQHSSSLAAKSFHWSSWPSTAASFILKELLERRPMTLDAQSGDCRLEAADRTLVMGQGRCQRNRRSQWQMAAAAENAARPRRLWEIQGPALSAATCSHRHDTRYYRTCQPCTSCRTDLEHDSVQEAWLARGEQEGCASNWWMPMCLAIRQPASRCPWIEPPQALAAAYWSIPGEQAACTAVMNLLRPRI